MSGSDWSPDSPASDVEKAPTALTALLAEQLTQQHPPRVTQRRRGRSYSAKEDTSDSSSRSDSVVEVPAPKQPRLDLVAMIGAALRRGDTALLPPGSSVESLSAQIVDALRRSSAGGDVAKSVTYALGDPLNEELRSAVLRGAMSPAKLVALDEVSLLNPVQRAAQEKARLDRLEQRSVEYLEKLSLTKTNIYTCPACGSRECYANFRSTDFVKWGGDDATPTLLRCCKCAHSFRS